MWRSEVIYQSDKARTEAVIKGPTAESSGLCNAEKLTADNKLANKTVKFEIEEVN